MAKKIVLVDDDEKIAQLSGQSLISKGYTVQVFTDPYQAKEFLLDNTDFDVLISDNIMPGLNGIDLVSQCVKKRPNLCCILATGDDSLHNSNVESIGNVRIVTKPFRRKDLIEIIESFNL